MTSRGRSLVNMCKIETVSQAETSKDTISIRNELEAENFEILTCESAPASVCAHPSTNINAPSSAPMPINLDCSPVSLNQMNIFDEDLFSENRCISSVTPSPVRPSSNISGINILPQTDEEPFSDSESSWIPDSDEEQIFHRKRKASLMQMNVKKQKKTYIRLKKKEKNTTVKNYMAPDNDTLRLRRTNEDIGRNMKDSEDLMQQITTNSQNESVPTNQNVIVEETTDCESIEDGQESVQNNNNLRENQKKNVRWKKSNPENWRRNIEMQKKRSCLTYKDRNGKIHAAKLPKQPNCNICCRYKCVELFSEEDRIKNCEEYWAITDFKQQKEYLLKRIRLKEVKRTLKNLPPEKQRKTSREYGFFKDSTEYVRVCKNFFMTTLCISTGPIETAVNNINTSGSFSGRDRRGKHTPHHKTADTDIEEVKKHIESFPIMDSHYCRKSSSRQYLDPKLSVSKMYDLYVKKMEEKGKNPVKLNIYKKIFGTQYNLAFFHPKKDQCCLCNRYHRTQDRDEYLQKEYEDHIARKEASFKSKQIDKKKSEEDESFLCVTMDLQSLLQIPATSDSLLYYCRKLNLYNLSIYEFKPPQNNAHCLIWTEVNGKRGSIEIASALNMWVKKIPETVTNLTIYSDTCSGQNRNQYMAAFLLHLVQVHPQLSVIEQKYLESGHSFMEVDSMHSAIEKEKRYTEAYSVIDWKGIMSRARSSRNNKNVIPYRVTELSYKDMIDVKALASKIIKNRTITDDNNEKVIWLKIKCLRFEKEMPGMIKFRYDYDGPYKNLYTLFKTGRATRSAPVTDIAAEELTNAYNHSLPISIAKKKDLLMLCKKKIIPEELHAWYQGLPSSNQRIDAEALEEEAETD